MRVLNSWGTDSNDDNSVGIDADGSGGGVADPPAQKLPPRLPRGGPDGEGRQLWQPPHPPPQGHGRRLAPSGPSAGRRLAPPRRAPGGNAGKGCIGVHPAQVGARLRLNAPQQGGNGGGVGLAMGRGSGWDRGQLGDLPVPAGARRCRRQRCLRQCGVNGGVIDACGGGVSSLRAAN